MIASSIFTYNIIVWLRNYWTWDNTLHLARCFFLTRLEPFFQMSGGMI